MLKLEEIATVLIGVSVREDRDGSARFVRLSDLSDLNAGRALSLALGEEPRVARALMIEEGDLAVGSRGIVTEVCVATPEMFGAFVSSDLYLVRPNRDAVDPRYLAAFLKLVSTQTAFARSRQGSGLARLPKEALERTEVPIPSIKTQRLIAGLSLSFDDESRLLKRMIELKSMLGRDVVARAFGASL